MDVYNIENYIKRGKTVILTLREGHEDTLSGKFVIINHLDDRPDVLHPRRLILLTNFAKILMRTKLLLQYGSGTTRTRYISCLS